MKSKWHKRWFQLVSLVSSWSVDPSTKVGAVIIPENSDIPVIGWNGFPRGVKDTPDRYEDRDIKYNLVSHAEANCIINAARNGINIKGATLYVSNPPCNECSKLIVQSGIKTVIYPETSEEFVKRWEKYSKFSDLILGEGGVTVTKYIHEEEKENR